MIVAFRCADCGGAWSPPHLPDECPWCDAELCEACHPEHVDSECEHGRPSCARCLDCAEDLGLID